MDLPSPSDLTKPLNAEHLRFKVWYRVLRHAKLRRVRLHDLRHTYASLLLQAGEPIGYVREQLGHSLDSGDSRPVRPLRAWREPISRGQTGGDDRPRAVELRFFRGYLLDTG